MSYVIGIDVGGTFTDAVAADDSGTIVGAKTPSTPHDYAECVLSAVDQLAGKLGVTAGQLLADTKYVSHGTTASLNALITGSAEQVGFVTTKGHADSIFIMNVESRYLGLGEEAVKDVITTAKPAYLVPKSHVVEVTERVDFEGEVIVPLDENEARAGIARLLGQGVRAIAVSLLWSFQHPGHERRIREIVHELDPDVFVALSHEVSPRIREFSRNATTILSTQVAPSLRRYLEPLQGTLAERGLKGPLLIMQSSGGTIHADAAPQSAITTVGSILTGGVTGARRLSARLGHDNVVTADVGGTTFLVGLLVNGEPIREASTVINQYPVNVPTIKVDVIGSGGGAIAWLDDGGNLRIGPRSAAAVPGPAAYGTGGTEPTVTDANLVLGILNPDYFLGGQRRLRVDLAEQALLTHIGEPLGLTAAEAAAAVYEVQNAQTSDLVRKVVVSAGHDPREFAVYAFGGAGPVHAAAFTAELGARELVVPLGAAASGFSAYGLASSDVILTAELSDPMPLDAAAPDRIARGYDLLERRVRNALTEQGIDFSAIEIEREFDARYTAQMFEVTAAAPAGQVDEAFVSAMGQRFDQRYTELYGQGAGLPAAGRQLITLRVRGVGRMPFDVTLPSLEAATSPVENAIKSVRPVLLDLREGFVDTPAYDYAALRAGHQIPGPAIIEVDTTTVAIPPGRLAHVDEFGCIRIPLT